MTSPLAPSYSASSDYFDNDPDFLRALQEVEIPGDAPRLPQAGRGTANPSSSSHEVLPSHQQSLKRRRSSDEEEEDAGGHHRVISSIDENSSKSGYLASDTYGASHFGEWGEYMSRKRAKLQIQNAEMDDPGHPATQKSRIFQGLQIYINGWTEPSVQDLRKLIIQHGGIFHAYLDKKSLVTHILTCSLTPAKVREFKYMRVVKPDWLVESAKKCTLLPWHDFIFNPNERLEDSQGRRVAQKSLLDGFASQGFVKRPVSAGDERFIPISTGSSNNPISSASGGNLDPVAMKEPTTPPRTPRKFKTPSLPTSPSRSLYTTDPGTPEQAKRVPGYAEAGSNKAAQRAMADPAWRAAHTSVAPDFIEGYYRNSRLHHLSTWKAELRDLVAEAQERAENGEGHSSATFVAEENDGTVGKIIRENMRGKGWGIDGAGDDVSMRGAQLVRKPREKGRASDNGVGRVIMHCDFDSFFVSAGLVERPHLRGKPAVVCHSQGTQGGHSSTSEVASASYEARKFGIKSGMSLQQARKLCPAIITIPYEFQLYKQFSLQFYTILMAHADDLQAVSVDEALIEVTNSIRRINLEIARNQESSSTPIDPAKEFADAIRAQVKKATGCEVSIGISHNIMLARLASRRAKPAGSYHLQLADLAEFLAPLHIDDLHGFGDAAYEKAEEKLGATSLGELAKMSRAVLCEALGKGTGETLYNAIRGVDDRKLESDKPRKSVSCDINYGIRFESNEQAETFIYQLAEEVVRRLDKIDMRGRSLTLKILKRDPTAPIEAPKFMGHGFCEAYTKQAQLVAPGGRATSDPEVIGEHAWRLLKSLNIEPEELRGIGLQIQKLEKVSANTEAEAGQAVLPFKPTGTPKKGGEEKENGQSEEPLVYVQPPSQTEVVEAPAAPTKPEPALLDLPSFSQVDMSVFEALPEDVREELEQEYKRRSRSVTPGVLANAVRNRSVSVMPPPKPKAKITVPGITKKPNVKRITRQLAPRSRSSLAAAKSRLFSMQNGKNLGSPSVKVSVEELRRLDIDPGVFFMLPMELQREQLALMRQKKAPGGSGLMFGSQRKVIKPNKLKGKPIPKRPPPKARYVEPPSLKQRGQAKGEKLYFTEKDDLQRVIGQWVDGFREYPPNQKDVDFFAKFLVQCVDSKKSTDTGLERAIAVTKWWLILLRRHFGAWEHVEHSGTDEVKDTMTKAPYTSEMVGRAWWRAFREVKEKMDVTARRKFGGCLSLR